MTPKLRALFAAAGIIVVSGTTYLVATLQPDATVADAVDAGLLAISEPARVRCLARVTDECRQAMSIARRYTTVQARARIIRDAGVAELPVLALDLPMAWRRCLRLVGTPEEACEVLEEGACTDATVCPANAPPQLEQLQCACRGASGTCTVGGQPAVFGVTLAAGSWTGAGCVRKYCGPVVFGDNDDWPATCPGG